MYELQTVVIIIQDHIDLLPTNSRTYTNVPETQHLIYMYFTQLCNLFAYNFFTN